MGLELTGATFSSNLDELIVTCNGLVVPDAQLQLVSPSRFTISAVLVSGENRLSIEGNDSQGLPFSRDVTLWAGDQTLDVDVVDETLQPVRGLR